MDYEHTQHGRLHYIFFVITVVMLAGAWLTLGAKVIRVGTDDVDGLARFLKDKRLVG